METQKLYSPKRGVSMKIYSKKHTIRSNAVGNPYTNTRHTTTRIGAVARGPLHQKVRSFGDHYDSTKVTPLGTPHTGSPLGGSRTIHTIHDAGRGARNQHGIHAYKSSSNINVTHNVNAVKVAAIGAAGYGAYKGYQHRGQIKQKATGVVSRFHNSVSHHTM